jgi:hypothetical protein
MESIERYLKEVIGAAQDGYTDQCITIEAEADPSRWVQLTWDALIFAYPSAEPPADLLAAYGVGVPDGVELTAWEPGKYVTFEHGADHLGFLVQFVNAYLGRVLGVDIETDPVTVSTEAL